MWNDGTTGKYSASLGFDRTDDIVTVPDNDIFSFGNSSNNFPFSISTWVKINDATNVWIVSKDDETTGDTKMEFQLYINSSDFLNFTIYDQSSGGYIGRLTNTAFPEGSWHHIVAAYDGGISEHSSIKLYIDGLRADKTPTAGGSFSTIDNTTAPLMIGYWIRQDGNPGNFYDGQMDDLKIFNYALTQPQVQTLYNQDSAFKF